ncbi:MAG: cation:proton antiporter, partial [Planctomycetota bacterium]|nr:cation:proton antiporter [Planctomycetota bacterium]
LLFQDAALVPLLLLIPLWTGDDSHAKGYGVPGLLLVSAILIVAVVVLQRLMAKWGVPFFARSRSPEIVVLFAIVVVGGVSFAAYQLGLPPAIGGFAAGLILGGNRLARQIDALMLSFRETFAAVFFVSLGMLFQPALVFQNLTVFALGLIAIVALKTVAATAALRLTGIAWRPALGTGIGMAHVGEFAFLLMTIALDAKLLSNQAYQRLFAVSLATLFLTPYLLQVGLRWARWTHEDRDTVASQPYASARGLQNVLVVGAGPVGRRVASQLESLGRDVCVIDLSPLNLQAFAQAGFRTVAGDATGREILDRAGAGEIQLAIVCVSADEAALQVVRAVRDINSACPIIVRCRYQETVEALHKHGATEVVSEEQQAAEQIARLLMG